MYVYMYHTYVYMAHSSKEASTTNRVLLLLLLPPPPATAAAGGVGIVGDPSKAYKLVQAKVLHDLQLEYLAKYHSEAELRLSRTVSKLENGPGLIVFVLCNPELAWLSCNPVQVTGGGQAAVQLSSTLSSSPSYIKVCGTAAKMIYYSLSKNTNQDSLKHKDFNNGPLYDFMRTGFSKYLKNCKSRAQPPVKQEEQKQRYSPQSDIEGPERISNKRIVG
jgi:hypothetical protein